MAGRYAPHSRAGGLLHCAETSSGDLFYWRTGGTDPDCWPVVSTGNDDWWEYDKGLVSLLAGLVSGDATRRGLPDLFLGDDRTVRVS
ncbi:hypothetical protein ACFUTR_09175 [Streptomyces sp. NPDC057367]